MLSMEAWGSGGGEEVTQQKASTLLIDPPVPCRVYAQEGQGQFMFA